MAIPTRPTQDAIIDPVWGQWVHDTLKPLKQYALGVVSGPKTADVGSHLQFTPAEFGLASFAGGIVTADRSGDDAGFAVVIAECWVVSPTQLAARMLLVNLGNSTIGNTPPGSVRTVHALAWGPPLPGTTAAARPGEEDRPEVEPLDDDA